eukprot:CAMPEP_0177593476 /NCGR_PEP_ID=MMETSP0419_2-20121207/9172_1 /TAXON_ID=582737 /ORGANISM="Tetraselmis sp., Strain GSL018" /LENGTH=247 /DNA_ID=CAMNT_0019084529 /DNA_START=107 /DNA_END=847 /DNA_ORIENTATION=+
MKREATSGRLAELIKLFDRIVTVEGGGVSLKISKPVVEQLDAACVLDRQLVLQQTVVSGDVLIELPVSEILTDKTALDDPDLGAAFKVLRTQHGADSVCVLALYLLCLRRFPELGKPHRAYVESLPDDTPSPLAWPSEVLEVLQGTSISGALRQQAAVVDELADVWVSRLFQQLNGTIVTPLSSTWPKKEDVLYAFSMVSSRSFAVPFPDGSKPLSLIPLVDMLDHNPSVDVEFRVPAAASGGPEAS